MTIDLVLRSAQVPSNAREDTGRTEVSWFANKHFVNRLRFSAWSSFKEQMKLEKSFVSGLSSQQANNADADLAVVRRDLDEVISSESDLISRGIAYRTLRAAKLLAACHSTCSGASFVTESKISSERIIEMLTPKRRGIRESKRPSDAQFAHVKPDFLLFASDEDISKRIPPLGTVEVKGPMARLMPDNVNGSSVSAVVAWLQRAFDSDPKEQNYIVNHFAQALTQAFHSRSGCGMLMNHNKAIFIGVGKPDGAKVNVKVSQVYKCNEQEGTVLAIVTWIAVCYRQAKLSHEAERKYRELELSDNIDLVGEPALYHPGSSSSAGSSASSPAVTKSRSISHHGKHSRDRGSGGPSGVESSGANDGAKKRMARWNELLSDFLLRCGDIESAEAVTKIRDDVLVEKALKGYREFVWDEGSGVVTKGTLGDTPIAVKYVHQAGGIEALYHVQNEFVTYCKLLANGGDEESFGVPKLIGCGVNYWYGPVVVTKFVGRRVRRCGEGRLRVGDEIVGKEEAEKIREAAMKSLRKLHERNVRHNDVELRNLQAERVEGGGWKAWWVDLGLALVETDRDRLEWEAKHCEEIFAADYTE